MLISEGDKNVMNKDKNSFDDLVRQGLSFMLRLALVLGGLGFASVFAVVLLVGGIYLIVTGHPSGGYALAGASVLAGIVTMALALVAVLKVKSGGMNSGIETA